MIIFDGKTFAARKEAQLKISVATLSTTHHIIPKVISIVFSEDEGGVVYASEKKLVATRVGIGYEIEQTSISNSLESLQTLILKYAQDPSFTGIIIQKPWRNTWELHQHAHSAGTFYNWWSTLTSLIPLHKDIDGLHPTVHKAIKNNTWNEKKLVLPATCKAVLSILDHVANTFSVDLAKTPTAIIGRSDLLGAPLSAELPNRGWQDVQLFGQKELQQALQQGDGLKKYKTIISSTGVKDLIKGDFLSPNSVLIDAGFPSGDMEFDSVTSKAIFLTPVPNGVGPVTVISLLENTAELCYNSIS